MNLDLPPPTVVAEAAALERLLRELEGAREVAVDTEADSFFNFREKVCLVQITAGERDWLVDPLARIDLAPLGRMLSDPRITKVFHDGEYDILILKRDFGFEFRNLFDTRVAAAALGIESPGLAAVLHARFGIELDKSLQRSNWSARPLSQQQISYARLDTHFLLPLMHEQRAELEQRGRAMIVEGECSRLEKLVPTEPTFSPDEFVQGDARYPIVCIRGAGSSSVPRTAMASRSSGAASSSISSESPTPAVRFSCAICATDSRDAFLRPRLTSCSVDSSAYRGSRPRRMSDGRNRLALLES